MEANRGARSFVKAAYRMLTGATAEGHYDVAIGRFTALRSVPDEIGTHLHHIRKLRNKREHEDLSVSPSQARKAMERAWRVADWAYGRFCLRDDRWRPAPH